MQLTWMDSMYERALLGLFPGSEEFFNTATRVDETNELNLSARFYWIYSSPKDVSTNTRSKQTLLSLLFSFHLSMLLTRLVLRKTTHLRKSGKIARGRWESTIDREPCKTPYPRHPRGQGSRDAARPFWKPARCFCTHRPCSGRWSRCNKKKKTEWNYLRPPLSISFFFILY